MSESMKDLKASPEGEARLPDRRQFLAEMGRWALGVLLGSVACSKTPAGGLLSYVPVPHPNAPLEGACVAPTTEVEKTLALVVDTVVPGPSIDPERAPGGLEACAVNLLLDDFYPFRPVAQQMAGFVELMSSGTYGKSFTDLTYDQRIEVLIRAQEQVPILRLAFRAIRSAFFGGAYNSVGLDYLGYPGPNLGYSQFEECSFRRPLCREMTETGWMP
jgi:hypothetical protein